MLAEQLRLGREHELPLIVHVVGEGSSVLAALRGHRSTAMLHRCSGRPSRFESWWKAGVYISVGPKVGSDFRLLEAVPDHLLLLESDAEHEDQAPWDTLPALYEAAAKAKNSLFPGRALVVVATQDISSFPSRIIRGFQTGQFIVCRGQFIVSTQDNSSLQLNLNSYANTSF